MRHNSVFILAFAAATAAYSPTEEQAWTPARQTDSSIDHEAQMAQGRSPAPTEEPKALFGRMDLQPRLEGYTLGPLTCGFVASNGNSLVCLSSTTDTCAYENGYMGCCEPNKDCSRIKTRCINYSQSQAGLCTSLTDYHTVCCNAASPACYTYTMTFSGGVGSRAGRFTALDCSPTAGFGKLLDYDPSWSKTHSFASSTGDSKTSKTTTSTAGPTTTQGDGGGGSSTNVGAIAGGTVGGVAALGLVGLGAFLLLRKKKAAKESDTSSPTAAMAQTQPPPQSPPQNYAGSPAAPQQGYQAPGFNQNTQSVYDPHMSMYSQQTSFSPQQQGYPQFQQQQQYNNQYPQQQQQPGYNYPGNTASFVSTPPPHTSPSPLADGTDKGTPSPHPTSPGAGQVAHGQQQAPMELPVQHPVGNEHNRAELGGS